MPFTPYHFGPNGFIGLVFRKWIDLPVFLLVNVLIDIEVIADHYIQPGWPVHRIWHFHTLLIGSLAGAVLGAALYLIKPLRTSLEKLMTFLRIPSKPTFLKMTASGVLGAWFHVIIDHIYHYDVQPFWPSKAIPLYRLITRPDSKLARQSVETACIIFWLLAGLVYLYIVVSSYRKQKYMEQKS